jgi:hypothetical protein
MHKPAPFLAHLVPYLTAEQAKWQNDSRGNPFPLLRRILRPLLLLWLTMFPAACVTARSAHSVAGETAAPSTVTSK